MNQPLTNIVSVTVVVSPTAPAQNSLNIGLIVGPSTIISQATRTVSYANTSAMLTAGWQGTEPEYKAAQAYFSQSPTPQSVIIGRQGTVQTQLTTGLTNGQTGITSLAVQALPEAIASGTSLTIGSGGTTQTVTTSANAAANATTISVTSFTANAAYATGTSVSAAETLLEAVQACRVVNNTWYGVYATGAAAADIIAIAGYIQSASPNSAFFYDTSDSAVLNGTAGNVMATLQTNKDSRSWGIYSTSQYAGAAAMGEAMGSNTGLANSAFTMAYKSLVGVTPEQLTTQQASTITGYNGNIYTTYGNNYQLLVQGTMADGTPFDQVLNLDTLAANIQTAAMLALTQLPKIPQTDAGVSILVNDIASVCAQAVTQGILAPGVWTAPSVVVNSTTALNTGTNLPQGYIILADTIANQSASDRSARKSPPIYACVKMAGAIEHAVIGLIVN